MEENFYEAFNNKTNKWHTTCPVTNVERSITIGVNLDLVRIAWYKDGVGEEIVIMDKELSVLNVKQGDLVFLKG